MTEASIIELTLKGLILVLILSLPAILVAGIVGVCVSLFQALTQIQDQTISFAIKLIAVVFAIILTARWLGGEIYNYALNLFVQFPFLVK